MPNPIASSKTVLITGASSGIGHDLAILVDGGGFDLVLLARAKEALETLADRCRREHHVRAQVLVKDLSDPAAPAQIYQELRTQGTPVEILVNNAGFGTHGTFIDAD